MSEASAPKSFRLQQSSPAAIGMICAVAAALLPLAVPAFFFFISLPLLTAAFVLAIVALVRGGIFGGIFLLLLVFFAFPVSIVTMIAGTKSRVDRARAVRQEHVDALAAKHKTEKKTEESPEPTASSPEIAESTPAPPTLPMIISLRQSVSIQLPHGNTVLPIGTRIQFIGRNGESVRIRYMDADYEIPISATDLQ
jgi:hypothetical protein